MKQFDKLIAWRDSFQNKAVGWLAFITTLGALIGFFPTIIGVGVYVNNTICVIIHAAQHVEDSKELNTYQNFAIMQLSSAVHEEMDTKIVYGVELEESNNGDLWYFTKIKVFGKKRPIIYSATLKHKGKRVSITDMYGEHKWLKKK